MANRPWNLESFLDALIVELDRARDTPPTTYRLVDDVAGFRVAHLTGKGQWVEDWPRSGEAADLPRAVRVDLTLASGETVERWFALR